MRRSLRSALFATTLLASCPAFAQDAAEEGASDEIIVTAQKRSESLQNVPLSIQAIGTEKLDQLQVSEFQDYVKFLPSVTIQQGGPGFAQVFFRGVASGENGNHSASQPTVGMYLDEQPITTIQGALDIHVYDIARVEALAGPQGTLYGASSMAGTIKIVTNKPDKTGFEGAMGLEVNSVAHGDVGGTLEGFVNAPIGENAAIRLVGWYRRDGGYIDNVAGSRRFRTSGITQNNTALVENNYNDVETYGGRLALGIDLDDNWTVTPTLMGQIQKAGGSFSQERNAAKRLQVVQYNPESSVDKWYNAGLTIEGKIGNWDLTYAGGFLNRRDRTESDYSDYSYFYDAVNGSGFYVTNNAGAYISPNQYIQGADRYKKYFSELRVSSPSDKRLRLTAGLFWQRQAHNIEQNYIIDSLATALKVPGTTSNVWLTKQLRIDRDIAAFGEISFDLTDKLTVTGGLRVYKYKNSLQGFFGYGPNYFGGSPGVGLCTGPAIIPGTPCTNANKTTSDSDFIHKINATYKIDDNKLIYATWSRGFRPGGVNRRATLPPYGPDQLDNFEIGWKTSFGRFRWNGAVYQLPWDNIQISLLGLNGLTQIQNAGKARIRGVETDIGYRQGGFSVNAGISYNDAKITRNFCSAIDPTFTCSTSTTLAPAGTRLPVSPKFKGNIVTRYEFPLGGDWEAHGQAAVTHNSGRTTDLRTLQAGIKGTLGAYTTADFSVGIQNDVWSLEAFATNLFDSGGVQGVGTSCRETICGTAPIANAPRGGVFYESVVKPRLIGLKASRKF